MIVVTGATGNVGRPLVRALAAAGAAVTAVARRAADVPAGVRLHRGELADPASLPLAGAEALFLLTPAGFRDVDGVLAAAGRGGVRRVVLLSSQGVGTGRYPTAVEDAVTGSGLEWTVLRPGGFASNAVRWAESVRTRRVVAAPFPDVALPVVDPADLAAVAALALLDAAHAGRTHTLTGPAPISPRGQAAVLADVVGAPVELVELTAAQARPRLPEAVADVTLAILGSPTPAETVATPDIPELLGRKARSFADWARANVRLFR